MPSVCPKPCSRLATAAVFISVGVVQLLAGVILLRSKYAELLSGPNFMTASSNIGIGCVFGLTSSIWKDNRKKRSKKLAARNNVLASLLISIIAANLTTAAVLIMGDGNRLLTLYLETNHKHISATFANEVLAGAYITSVCSPIVCFVVAVVSLSGNCFQLYSRRRKSLETDILEFESPFGWVYDPKARVRLSLVSDNIETTTPPPSDRSRYSEDSVFSENKPMPFRQKFERNIPSPVSTWSQKRDHILKNSALLKRSQLFASHLPRTILHQDSNQQNIPHAEEPSNMKRQQRSCTECMSPNKNFSKKQKRSSLDSAVAESDCQQDTDYTNYRTSKHCEETNLLYNSRFTNRSDGSANGCRSDLLREVAKPDDCLEKGFRQYPPTSNPRISDANTKIFSQNAADTVINAALMKLKIETMKELKARMQRISPREQTSLDTKQTGTLTGILKQPESGVGSHVYKPGKNSSVKDVSFSEDNYSDVSENTDNRYMEESEKDFTLGPSGKHFLTQERRNSTKQSSASTSVSDHTNPHSSTIFEEAKYAGNVKSNSFVSLMEVKSLDELTHSEADFIPQPNNEGSGKFKNLILDCPKIPSIKLQNRKRDVALRMSSMSSITESPSEEAISEANLHRTTIADTDFESGSLSENSESSLNKDENSNITDLPYDKDISSNYINTRRLPSNASLKKVLKRMWSSASPETKLNLSELIVDNDSLIGLTEEELIARTLRIRALSKGFPFFNSEIRLGIAENNLSFP